jgi:hypothetical protein
MTALAAWPHPSTTNSYDHKTRVAESLGRQRRLRRPSEPEGDPSHDDERRRRDGLRGVDQRLSGPTQSHGLFGDQSRSPHAGQHRRYPAGAAPYPRQHRVPRMDLEPKHRAPLRQSRNCRCFPEFQSLGRMAEPEEIASAIAFLLSSDASFITGRISPSMAAIRRSAPRRWGSRKGSFRLFNRRCGYITTALAVQRFEDRAIIAHDGALPRAHAELLGAGDDPAGT